MKEKDQYENNLLHQAVISKKPEIVKILLTHPNINVGEESLNGDILKDRPEITEILRLHEIKLSEKAQDNYSTASNETEEVLILGTSEAENCDN